MTVWVLEKKWPCLKPIPRRIKDACRLPRKFRMTELILFSGDNDVFVDEHIIIYEYQCKDFDNDYHIFKIFVCSLTGTSFQWYSYLHNYTIHSWEAMVSQFKTHFGSTIFGVTRSDLSEIQQKIGELVRYYLIRFKNTKIICLLASQRQGSYKWPRWVIYKVP